MRCNKQIRGVAVVASVAALLAAAGCSGPAGVTNDGRLQVVASVSPIVDLVKNVAGDAADVQGLIPEGVDSHTFEPTPETAKSLAGADVIFLNGLDLEDPTLRLAQANKKDSARIVLLGPRTITPAEYVYDFSFPKSEGHPNPHLWMDVAYAEQYVRIVQRTLSAADPAHADTYRSNAGAYLATLQKLDAAVQTAVDTIPAENRKLLTYHDSFAYFARRYGLQVIGAIQPSDFSEPSAQDVANLIDQIERTHVPAIFGSEVFPSPVLQQIAQETGARYEDTLRDDDLPGDPGQPDHSYVGLMKYDVSTMVKDLGGDPAAVDAVSFDNPYD
jgi:ABC-type Zn uptake system ZnuABC Zn-binding protein ZnuA